VHHECSNVRVHTDMVLPSYRDADVVKVSIGATRSQPYQRLQPVPTPPASNDLQVQVACGGNQPHAVGERTLCRCAKLRGPRDTHRHGQLYRRGWHSPRHCPHSSLASSGVDLLQPYSK